MSEIVQFPGAVAPADHSLTEAFRDLESKVCDPDDARRAKAYFDMEPNINDVVCMGKIAAQLMSDPDRNLYDFAVAHLSRMLDELKAHYYAMDFPA
jgi:hypothetical protein